MAEPGEQEQNPGSAAPAPPSDAAATERMEEVSADEPAGPRLLGSTSFFRLWLAQVVSSLGDWTGLVAILALANRVGGDSPEAAIGLVMSARLVPGFFLGSLGGVLVDRWDRKKVMVSCDVGRGMVLATLPFVDTVAGLVVASLLLEALTLLWSPAKEASVPNLVKLDQLAKANSLSLVAAYGTFPLGSALFASLTKVAEFLGDHAGPLDFLRLNQESLAIYADMATFLASALLISTLALPQSTRGRRRERIDLGRTFTEIKEGWRYIGTSPLVRSVMIGLGTGLIGGGTVVPLGPTFASEVLRSGSAGFGLLLTSLGMGVAVGVVGVSAVQQRLPHQRVFPLAVVGAGAALMAAASMSTLAAAMAFVAAMGVCAGAVYVLGFTILQESVQDELRGRIFAAFYSLSRLALLASLAAAPFVSGALDGLSQTFLDGEIDVYDLTVSLPGVRLTLWLGATIILVAGVLAIRSLQPTADRRGQPQPGNEGT